MKPDIVCFAVVYNLIAKMLAYRLHNALHAGLHPHQNIFVSRKQIHDNISNALIMIEFAKYSQQEVCIVQVDIAKAFDTIQWHFIS